MKKICLRLGRALISAVILMISLSGCALFDGSLYRNGTSAEAKETAVRYMQEKYGLNCIATAADVFTPELMGDSYYKVYMRMTDDPAGEKLKERDGQSYLDRGNYVNSNGTVFAVFVEGTCESVIGDQYMWYDVYPMLNVWMTDALTQFESYPPYCRFYYCDACETRGRYEFCFSPDFSAVTSAQELEEQFPKIRLYVEIYYPESAGIQKTEHEWDAFQAELRERYDFGSFKLNMIEVPDSDFQAMTEESGT